MKIRIVKEHDIAQLTALEAACFPLAEAASYDILHMRIQSFPASFLVMENEHGIIGMINGCVSDHMVIHDDMYTDSEAHKENGIYQTVLGLDVHPGYQHLGYGGMLMKAFQDLARNAGREGVILTCKKEKIGFYEQFGFHRLGRSASQHGGAIWYDMLCVF